MVRAFGAFLVLFSILSFVVDLQVLGSVFAMSALSLFAVAQLPLFAKSPRSSRVPGAPLF
jgi:hypothetical protein